MMLTPTGAVDWLTKIATDPARPPRGAQGPPGPRPCRIMLLYALTTALKAADMVGSIGVITHPLDDGVRAFYAKLGFEDLPLDPRRAMIVRMAELRKGGISG